MLTSAGTTMIRTLYNKVNSWLDHTKGHPVYVEQTLKGKETIEDFTYFGLRQNIGVGPQTRWKKSPVGRVASDKRALSPGDRARQHEGKS